MVKSAMRLLLLILATATTVLSAGLLLVLFLIPSTSLVSNVIQSRTTIVFASAAFLFVILLISIIAGTLVLYADFRHSSVSVNRLATRMVSLAAAAVIVDLGASIVSSAHRIRSIWWLDALLVALALSYWGCKRSE
jgi:hypothetical protein